MTAVGDAEGWRIRPFEMSDYDAVYALWLAGAPGIEIRPSDGREEVARRCQRDRELFLVAEGDGAIIGVVMGGWDGRRGWIHHLAVAPDFRGLGLGRSLVAAIEERLCEVGCLKVNLLVRRENRAARQLYEHLGYREAPTLVAMGKELRAGQDRR
ncbi:MAG: GNAT family acetyltransferase [Chloroflexi bacterium]|nr:GNAT family acetyltransferase [Chloroflexota bacterium]